jgi:hypothetical protein
MHKYFTAFNSTHRHKHVDIVICGYVLFMCAYVSTLYMHMHKCELCLCLHSFSLILEYVNLVSKKHMH